MAHADDLLADAIYTVERELEREIQARSPSILADVTPRPSRP